MAVVTSNHPAGSNFGQTVTFTPTVSPTAAGANTPASLGNCARRTVENGGWTDASAKGESGWKA